MVTNGQTIVKIRWLCFNYSPFPGTSTPSFQSYLFLGSPLPLEISRTPGKRKFFSSPTFPQQSELSIISQVKALCWFCKQAWGYAQAGAIILYSGKLYWMLFILVLRQVNTRWEFGHATPRVATSIGCSARRGNWGEMMLAWTLVARMWVKF